MPNAINESVIDFGTWGSGDSQSSEEWLSALVDNAIEMREGLCVLDYGCGGGRLCNYLSKQLEKFSYYGLEPAYGQGPAYLNFARSHFNDPRVVFDYIGSPTEIHAIKNADYVVLGSVLTHMPYEDAIIVMDKFRSVVAGGGKIVASVFIGDRYVCLGTNCMYGSPNFYSLVHYTPAQLGIWEYDVTSTFLAQGVNLHHILSIRGYRS